MEKIKATELVVDFRLYPRGDVSDQHISYMVRSLEAGHSLPPILVDRKSMKIVDGVHRWHAHRKATSQEDCLIECILKTYKDERELFLDSVRLNAVHGSALTTFDRTKCLLKADELKIPDEDIAMAMQMTVERLTDLRESRVGRLRISTVEGSKVASFSENNLIPLKRSIRHMSGRTLTKRQAEINEHLSGMNAMFHVNQLLMLIEGDLIDLDDQKLYEALRKLASAIVAFAPSKR